MKKDIGSEKDISLLIDAFYTAILSSPNLRPFFDHLSWEEHLPHMKRFWCFVLLDQPGYSTNVTEKHIQMPLKKEHFDEWINLFCNTMDALFEGEKATLGKERAKLIGQGIQHKMGLFKNHLN
jgi:hemoglobin